MAKQVKYFGSIGRNGTEDEIIIHAPNGREMARIWFWDAEHGEPGVGDKEAKTNGQLIIAALNAYRPEFSRETIAPEAVGAYYSSVVPKALFETHDAVYIHAPNGHGMAFIELQPEADAVARAKADAQFIVDALNGYQRQAAMEVAKSQERKRTTDKGIEM